jgi:hypothetical protein
MKNLITIFIFAIFLISCSSIESSYQGDLPCINIEIDVNSPVFIKAESVIERKIVQLETIERSLIGEISKLFVTNDRIFVLDSDISQGLFVFNIQGKFLFSINKRGQGPGDFYSINDFFVDSLLRQISIYDTNLRRIHFYDWNGKFIRSHDLSKFWFHSCYPVNENTYALNFTSRAININNFHLLLINKENTIVYRYKKLITDFGFTSNNHIAFYCGYQKNYYVAEDCDTIFEISSNGIESGLCVNFGKNKLPKNFFKELSRSTHAEKLLSSNYCYGIRDICETSEMISFQYLFGSQGRASFFNKETHKTYNGVQYFPPPMASSDEFFIGIYDAEMVLGMFGLIDTYPDEYNGWLSAMVGEENLSLLNNVKEDDNPLVVFYKIKSDI